MGRSKSHGGKSKGDKKRKANDDQSSSAPKASSSSSRSSSKKHEIKKLKIESHPQTEEKDNKNDQNYIGTKEMDDLPPEVLVQILKHLSAFDLIKKCRLVNRKWLEVASLALSFHEKSTRVKFILDTEKDSSSHIYKVKENCYRNGKTLQEFIDCYHSSSSFFPYNNFAFKSVPKMDFNSPDITAFFSEMGSTVKSLTLISNYRKRVVPFLRQVLLKHAPNIKDLKILEPSNKGRFIIRSYFSEKSIFPENIIENTDESSDDESDNIFFLNKKDYGIESSSEESENDESDDDTWSDGIQLPHLCKLSIGKTYNNCYFQMVMDIVMASPNLTVINGPWSKKLKEGDIKFWLSIPWKFSTSQVGLDPHQSVMDCWKAEVVGNEERLPDWTRMRIVSNGMKFMYFGRSEAANFINMIVELKKDKLTYVELGAIGVFPGINWSNFDGVEELYLKNINHSDHLYKFYPQDFVTAFFPSNANTISMFPNVKEINFYVGCPKKNFPSKGNIPKLLSVETATINGETPKVCIEKISALCPNLTKVVIKFPQICFTALAKVMWKNMKNLQELTIYVDLFHSARNVFPELDAGFTGFTKETCQKLWERIQAKEDRQKLRAEFDKIPRPNPSIMDLKDLKRLNVKICDIELTIQSLLHGKLRNAVTNISYMFAFNQMKDLQVNIEKNRLFREFFRNKIL